MKRRVCMAILLGVAVALIGWMVNADESAKPDSDKTAPPTVCASGGCGAERARCGAAKSGCGAQQSACGAQTGCGSETAIKQVSLTEEKAACGAAKSGCGAEKSACGAQARCESETAIKQVSLTKEEADKAKKTPKVLCPVSGTPAKKEAK